MSQVSDDILNELNSELHLKVGVRLLLPRNTLSELGREIVNTVVYESCLELKQEFCYISHIENDRIILSSDMNSYQSGFFISELFKNKDIVLYDTN